MDEFKRHDSEPQFFKDDYFDDKASVLNKADDFSYDIPMFVKKTDSQV